MVDIDRLRQLYDAAREIVGGNMACYPNPVRADSTFVAREGLEERYSERAFEIGILKRDLPAGWTLGRGQESGFAQWLVAAFNEFPALLAALEKAQAEVTGGDARDAGA